MTTELPPEPAYARADVERIALILDALLSNAVKLSAHGGKV